MRKTNTKKTRPQCTAKGGKREKAFPERFGDSGVGTNLNDG
jgi:hypothetical protein